MSHRKPQPAGRSMDGLVTRAFTPVTVTAFIGLALIGIVVVAAVGGLGSSAIAVPTVTVTVTATVTAPGPVATAIAQVTATAAPARRAAPPASTPAASIAGTGTFLIGSDVKSGLYKSAGPATGSARCDWVVRSHTKGLDRIVASKNAAGPTQLTLPATAYSVQTTGCQPFQRSVRRTG